MGRMSDGDTITGVGASEAITLTVPSLSGSCISFEIQPNSMLTLTGLAICHGPFEPDVPNWIASSRRKAA